MKFFIETTIQQKKQLPFKGLVNVLILVLAIPVILIAAASLLLYFLFHWLKDRLIKPGKIVLDEGNYHLELDLIKNNYIRIVLVEDESDEELTQLNEAWQESVYNEETCLYRAKTTPILPAIEGRILCFYLKEHPGGMFLQLVTSVGTGKSKYLDTELVFLEYRSLEILPVGVIGSFFLQNDDNDSLLIHGSNKKENLEIRIVSE